MTTSGPGDQPGPVAPRRSPVGLAVMLMSVLGFLLLCFRLRDFFTDDSWISVRYAENLADGHGFVWNPGGEQAEGFSNPLLVYGEALAHLLGLSAVTFARALGVLCGAGCVALVYLRGRDVLGETGAQCATVLTGLCPPFALWAVGGLETTVTALVITAAVLELARRDGGRPLLAGILLALLPWLRPEGLAVALPLVLLSEMPGVWRAPTRRRSMQRLAWVGGLPVLSQVALEILRLMVYGHLVPNSVIYKSGTGPLVEVAGQFLAQGGPVLVLAAVGVILATDRRWLVAAPPAVYVLGSIGTLNSVNTASRLLLPVWPQIALLAGVAVTALAAEPRLRERLAAVVAVAACVILVVGLQPGNVRDLKGFTDTYMSCRHGARGSAAGWIRSNTPQDAVVSISDAGLVPARSGGRTFIDQFLLNEPLIQETGGLGATARAEVVFDRAPDVIVLASRRPDTFVGRYGTDRVIHAHPGMADFQLHHVAKGGGPRCDYHLFIHRQVS